MSGRGTAGSYSQATGATDGGAVPEPPRARQRCPERHQLPRRLRSQVVGKRAAVDARRLHRSLGPLLRHGSGLVQHLLRQQGAGSVRARPARASNLLPPPRRSARPHARRAVRSPADQVVGAGATVHAGGIRRSLGQSLAALFNARRSVGSSTAQSSDPDRVLVVPPAPRLPGAPPTANDAEVPTLPMSTSSPTATSQLATPLLVVEDVTTVPVPAAPLVAAAPTLPLPPPARSPSAGSPRLGARPPRRAAPPERRRRLLRVHRPRRWPPPIRRWSPSTGSLTKLPQGWQATGGRERSPYRRSGTTRIPRPSLAAPTWTHAAEASYAAGRSGSRSS